MYFGGREMHISKLSTQPDDFSNAAHTTAIATPPTDKSTPLKQTDEEDESSHCTLSFLLDNDEFAGDDEFNIQSPSTPFQGTKVDYANGIGMFLTLAAAAQQASTIHQQQLGSGNRRSLFDDSFDLKEVVCEGTVCIT
jgi:hypothetical protein